MPLLLPEKIIVPSIQTKDYKQNRDRERECDRGQLASFNYPKDHERERDRERLPSNFPKDRDRERDRGLASFNFPKDRDRASFHTDYVSLADKRFDYCSNQVIRADFGEKNDISTKKRILQSPFLNKISYHAGNFLSANLNFISLNDVSKSQIPSKTKSSLMKLLENQKIEGFWEPNEENSSFLGKFLKDILDNTPNDFTEIDQTNASLLWMTNIILFYLETFQKDEKGFWKLIWEKGKHWMTSKGFDYRAKKEK